MKKSTLSGITAILLAGILAGGVCACGYASRDKDTGKWFQNGDITSWTLTDKEEPQTQAWGGVVDNVGNEMNAVTTYAMPTAMAFYSLTDTPELSKSAAPSVTVTCSHNFEFNNVLVDWSVEYLSGASASDIVTVTPTSNGSLTATLTCLGAFSEPLTLKATLRGNEEKTATCTIDYVKRISNVNYIAINASDFGDDSGLGCYPVFGTGTVKGNLSLKNVTWKLESDFERAVQSYLKFPINFTYHKEYDKLLDEYYSYDGDTLEYSMFIENFDNYDEAHKNAIYYAWWTAYNSSNYFKDNSMVILEVEIEVFYNGKIIQTYSESEYYGGSSRNYLTGEYYGIELSPNLTLNGNVAL